MGENQIEKKDETLSILVVKRRLLLIYVTQYDMLLIINRFDKFDILEFRNYRTTKLQLSQVVTTHITVST